MISEYFSGVKNTLKKYAYVISSQSITEKTYSDKKGFIEGEVIFHDESKLEFTEVKDADKHPKVKYCYHYMDEKNNLVFRFDNAKHYPNLPHHKHTSNGVEESKKPEIVDVLSAINIEIAKKKK